MDEFGNFVAFDLETTGTDRRVADPVEIGALRYADGAPRATFRTLVALPSGARVPPESTKVHGITDEDLRDAPSARDAIEALVEFVGPAGTVVVGHNIEGYDLPLLRAAASRSGCSAEAIEAVAGWRPIDTCRLARARVSGTADYRLGTLCALHGVALERAHTALDDAAASAALLQHLARDGESAESIAREMGGPVAILKMPYGQHKGWPFSSIPESYLRYVSRHEDRDVRHTAQLELRRWAEEAR